ncbi:MAG: hypothetical protein QOE00_2900 [Ilumatobacteraceae bacterium]
MRSTADGATTATQQQQDQTNDEQDDSDGPQDPDPEDQAEEQEDESENNHVWAVTPALARSNAFCRPGPTAMTEATFSSLQGSVNADLSSWTKT